MEKPGKCPVFRSGAAWFGGAERCRAVTGNRVEYALASPTAAAQRIDSVGYCCLQVSTSAGRSRRRWPPCPKNTGTTVTSATPRPPVRQVPRGAAATSVPGRRAAQACQAAPRRVSAPDDRTVHASARRARHAQTARVPAAGRGGGRRHGGGPCVSDDRPSAAPSAPAAGTACRARAPTRSAATYAAAPRARTAYWTGGTTVPA